MSKNQQKYNARMAKLNSGYFDKNTNLEKEMGALQAYYDAMPEGWSKTEMALSMNPALSKRNVNLETANSSYQEDGIKLPELEKETIFDKIFTKDALAGAIGNVAGNAVNAGFNALLQENQLDNQKELMNKAAQKNAQAVQQQAVLQTEGMKQAGLNPAQVTGTGAPSVQAGAAAGATSTMGNIFAGIADLIAASKAPSEIEKLLAESALANKTTEEKIPAEVGKLQEEISLIHKQADSAQNALDQYEAYKGFLETHMPTVAEDLKLKYESLKAWDKLSPKTRDTIDGIIDGTIKMGPGEYDAFIKDIEAQKLLADTDKGMLDNIVGATIIINQMKDPKVRDALYQEPRTQRRLAESTMATQGKERENLSASAQNTRINTQGTIANDLDLQRTSKEAQDILRQNNPDSTKNNVENAEWERKKTKGLETLSGAANKVGDALMLRYAAGGVRGKVVQDATKSITQPYSNINPATGLPHKPNQRSQNASYDNNRSRYGKGGTAPW